MVNPEAEDTWDEALLPCRSLGWHMPLHANFFNSLMLCFTLLSPFPPNLSFSFKRPSLFPISFSFFCNLQLRSFSPQPF